MKLKTEIIERIKGNREALPLLQSVLKKNNRQYIRIMVRRNIEDSPLTTLAALTALQGLFGIEDINDMIEKNI